MLIRWNSSAMAVTWLSFCLFMAFCLQIVAKSSLGPEHLDSRQGMIKLHSRLLRERQTANDNLILPAGLHPVDEPVQGRSFEHVRRQSTSNSSSLVLYSNASFTFGTAIPSSACKRALTASIGGCSQVISYFGTGLFNSSTSLSTLCTSTCSSALASYRSQVASACAGFTFASDGAQSSQPTYAADLVILNYRLQCLQDPDNSAFCVIEDQAKPTATCSVCQLAELNTTLSSAIGYNTNLATYLYKLLAGPCSGSQFVRYNVTRPPAGVNSSAPSPTDSAVGPTLFCSLTGRNVTFPAATSCASIATTYNVSYFDVLNSNEDLTASSCAAAAGQTLCLPQPCSTYVIRTNDTCASISSTVQGQNVPDKQQLISINPELGASCEQVANLVGTRICLSPNGGWPTLTASSGPAPSSTPTAKAPVPSPVAPNTTTNCGQYYKIGQGDMCYNVTLANSISLEDFFEINPMLNTTTCNNLWLGYYYCVAPYPPLHGSPVPVSVYGNLTTNSSSFTFKSEPLPPPKPTPPPAPLPLPSGIPAPSDVASGTIRNYCFYYTVPPSSSTCASLGILFNHTASEIALWNKGIDCKQTLPTDVSLCVSGPDAEAYIPPSAPPSNVAKEANQTACATYYTVVANDTCGTIPTKFGINSTTFAQLNPGLNSGCTNLYLGEAYCVQPASNWSPPTASNPPSGGSNGAPSNVAQGTLTANCTKYYTVTSNDNCGTICSAFKITTDMFRAYNPQIDSGCTNLLGGEAYCVASTNNATCTKTYTVVANDSCGSIDNAAGLTFAQLQGLNPSINSGCTNIYQGEILCIANATVPMACSQRYTVQSGDLCSTIAPKYNLSVQQLQDLNPGMGCNALSIGQVLCVKG